MPLNNSRCRITQLSFNFETNEFFEIARNNTAGECDVLGVILPRLEKPRISQIVEGYEIIVGEFDRINNEVRSYFSSAFRKQVETVNLGKMP